MLHLAKIRSFGINIPQFLVDLRVCSSLLGNLFVYPLCSTFFHAEPSWALNTKKRFQGRQNASFMATFMIINTLFEIGKNYFVATLRLYSK